MENRNLTVWQRLTRALGPNALMNQDFPVYKLDKKELLRTTDKTEYEREKLQAKQSFYLANQFAKVENNLYTQAVYYEPNRLASYYDYESMEYTPEISAAWISMLKNLPHQTKMVKFFKFILNQKESNRFYQIYLIIL